jgi:hypothetical protein
VTRQGSELLKFEKRNVGHLENFISVPIADAASVNVYESEREQNRIIRRQFYGVRAVAAIFRGALFDLACRTVSIDPYVQFPGQFGIFGGIVVDQLGERPWAAAERL